MSRLDPLNFAALKIEPFYNDIKLGDATGFFYFGFLNGHRNFWLVTNWHVVTGRNVDNPTLILNKEGSIPNRMRVNLLLNFDQPEYNLKTNLPFLMQEIWIDLYDKNGSAFWYQHLRKNDFDVAVINCAALGERFHRIGINEIAQTNDMVIQLGSDVFILGYPLGFTHFIKTPIWKKGVIASEPHLETAETRNRVVIDATTRQGMSGSPVIMRASTHYISENGNIIRGINATRFIGIYSSRPAISASSSMLDEDRRAEVGFFYKSGCINEAIQNGIVGHGFNEIP